MKKLIPLALIAVTLAGASTAQADGGFVRARVLSSGCASAFSTCDYAVPLVQSYSLVQPVQQFVQVQAFAAAPVVQAFAVQKVIQQRVVVQQVKQVQVQQVKQVQVQRQVIRQRAFSRY